MLHSLRPMDVTEGAACANMKHEIITISAKKSKQMEPTTHVSDIVCRDMAPFSRNM